MNILFNMAKSFLKKHYYWLILVVLAISFFIGTASYNYITQSDGFTKWSSPDEAANYIFSKLYGQTGEMTIFEKYNLVSDDIIHPRSFASLEGNLKPVSFLGIILIYGFLASLTSYKILPFLTPAFAAIGILFFYLLVKKIFGRRHALISTFILAVFPPYFYYSARSMFHNVLFIALLIIGLYFAMMMAGRKKADGELPGAAGGFKLDLPGWIFSALAGLFFGLAITARASELIWLAPVLFVLWLFNLRKIGFTKLIIFLSALFLAVLPVLYWNQILYSSALASGYPEMNCSIETLARASRDLVKSTATGNLVYNQELISKIKNSIFHFGFNPKQSLRMLYYYFTNMFPWLFWPAVLGCFIFLQNFHKWRRKHLVYFLNIFIISLILVFYYGSWKFYDNPDPASFTIGNSYTRYWLPIYLGAIPFASTFLIKLTRAIFPRGQKNPAQSSIFVESATITGRIKEQFRHLNRFFFINGSRVVLVALIYFISISFILFGSEEGLIYLWQNQKEAKLELEKVLALTEANSVIITRYHDKVFFPERKVIVGLFDNYNLNSRYAKLADYLPLYYYNFTFPEKDMEYLNNKRLKEVDLGIKKIEQVTSNFSLYKLYRVK